MPIREFFCETCSTTTEQVFLNRDIRPSSIQCPKCFCPANLVEISLPARIPTPDDSRGSFTYYENKKTGEVDFTSKGMLNRVGFEKKEARNHFERLAVEKKLRLQDESRLKAQQEVRDIKRSHANTVRHSEIRDILRTGEATMYDFEKKKDVKVEVDEATKGLLRKAIRRTNEKGVPKVESEFRLQVNHDDKQTRGAKK